MKKLLIAISLFAALGLASCGEGEKEACDDKCKKECQEAGKDCNKESEECKKSCGTKDASECKKKCAASEAKDSSASVVEKDSISAE